VTELATPGEVVTGSFVGQTEGGKRGDLMLYRIFFDLDVKTESGDALVTLKSRQDAKFEFLVPSGVERYSACIRSHERQATEVLYHTFVGAKGMNHGKVTAEELQPVQDTVKGLRVVLSRMLEEQLYAAKRDATHLATNESTGRRTVAYSLLEASGLILISLVQVRFVKHLFDGNRRRSGGVLV